MSEFFTDPRIKIREPGKLFINGVWSASRSAKALVLISPSDEMRHARVAAAGIEEIDRAVAAARDAFDHGPWPRLTAAERATILEDFGAHLKQRASELATCWSFQTGVPCTIATPGLSAPQTLYDYYAELIRDIEPVSRSVRDRGGLALLAREPVGVVAAIAPWNHPFHLMSLKVAPALAMGCTVIAKPAPESPLDVFIMAECAEKAGIPKGVFNIAPADREASDHLIRHPGIDKVSFTGSTATGSHIAALCGERMTRASMELGGKSAAIVLDDIEIEDVVRTLVPAGGFYMAGQGCAWLTRVLVSRARRDNLAEAYAAVLKGIKVGHAFEAETQMGPIAMKRQLDKVQGYIAKGLAEGARLVTGGGRPPHRDKGYFVEPTLFVDVSNNMTIAQQEIFGPVISMIVYKDEDDAIRIANDSTYGLNGAVYTNDLDKAYAVARRVRAGNFSQNGLQHDSKFPFGGYKQSGTGREGGTWGLESYTELKTIYMTEAPSRLD